MKRIAFLSVLVVAGMVGCAPTETQVAAQEAKEHWPLQLLPEVPVVQKNNSLTYFYLPLDPDVFDAQLTKTLEKDAEAFAEEKCKSFRQESELTYFTCMQNMKYDPERSGEYQHLFQIENQGNQNTQIKILSVQMGKIGKMFKMPPPDKKDRRFENSFFIKPFLFFLVGVQQNNTQPEQTYDYRLKYQKNFFDFKLKITNPSN